MFNAHLQLQIAVRSTDSDARMRVDGSRHGRISRQTARRMAHPIFGGRSR